MFLFALGVLLFVGQVGGKPVNDVKMGDYIPLNNDTLASKFANEFLDQENDRSNNIYRYTLDKIIDAKIQYGVFCECYKIVFKAAENQNCRKGENECGKPNVSDKRQKYKLKVSGTSGIYNYEGKQVN